MTAKKQIKVLLMGISGDVSMQKVLPGLARFEKTCRERFDVELIGYSRSLPDQERIKSISKTHGDGSLKITLIQGSYEQHSVISDTLEGIGECDRLIIYLALPPSVFLQEIKNACLYASFPIHIVIEKPYAESIEHLKELMIKIDDCNLTEKVHFFDHYLFKPALDAYSKDSITSLDYSSVCFSALETIGVENRMGYFAGTGTIKDMLPHLYALFQHYQLEQNPQWKIERLDTAEYAGYREFARQNGYQGEIKETFFDLSLICQKSAKKYVFTSGKRQSHKQTTVEFLNSDGRVIHTIDLQAAVTTGLIEQNEHTRLFAHLAEDNFGLFVSKDKVLEQWQLLDMISKYRSGGSS